MTSRTPTWYDWYYHQNPPTEAAKRKARRQITDSFLATVKVQQLLGKIDLAMTSIERAMPVARQTNDMLRVCRLLSQKSQLLQTKGEHQQVLDLATHVIEHLKNRQDKPAREIYGGVLNNLGHVYRNLGEHARALESYEEYKQVCAALDDRRGYSGASLNMGNVYYDQGNLDRALACYEEHMRISEAIGDRQAYGLAVGNIGIVYSVRGDYAQTLRYNDDKKRICEEIGDREGYAQALGTMGNVFLAQNEFDRALDCYEEVKQIFAAMGARKGYAMVVGNMGVVHYYLGNFERALSDFEEVRHISQRIGDRQHDGIALQNRGRAYERQGDANRALASFEEAVAVFRALKIPFLLCEALVGQTRVLLDQRQYDLARTTVAECITLASDIPRPDVLFEGRVLQARIAFHSQMDVTSKVASISALAHMLADTEDAEEQAELHYELWQMLTRLDTHFLEESRYPDAPEEHRQTALVLYQQLYEKTPKFAYKQRIEELWLMEPFDGISRS